MDETGLRGQDLIGRRIEIIDRFTGKCICRGTCGRFKEGLIGNQSGYFVTVDHKRFINPTSPKLSMRLSEDDDDVAYLGGDFNVFKWTSKTDARAIFSEELPDIILDMDGSFAEYPFDDDINKYPSMMDWAEIIDTHTNKIVARGKIISMKNNDNNHFDLDLISLDGKWFFNMKSGRFKSNHTKNHDVLEFTSIDDYNWCRWNIAGVSKIHDLYRENGYDELDMEVKDLVHELNEWPGVETVTSCCGHGHGQLWVTFNSNNLLSIQLILNALRTPDYAPELTGKFHISLSDEVAVYDEMPKVRRITPGANHAPVFGFPTMTDGSHGVLFTLATNKAGGEAYDAAIALSNVLRKLRSTNKKRND